MPHQPGPKLSVVIASTLVVVGLFCLVVAGVMYATTTRFVSDAEQTTGTVIGLEERISFDGGRSGLRTVWVPVVRFTAGDGRTIEFRGDTGTSPPAHDVGDSVTVAYDPDDPSDARIVSSTTLYLRPLLWGIFGVALTGIGGTRALLWVRGRRRRAWLRQHGQPVDAQVTAVTMDTKRRVNRRHPYVVYAVWHDPRSGSARPLRSERLWADPRPALDVGHRVRVLVDPDRHARHLMGLPGQPAS